MEHVDDNKRRQWETYFMNICEVVASRANCKRRKVGSLLVRDNRIIATGYNGTPTGLPNCLEGGCHRCSGDALAGQGYDECVCVHAEENVLLECARLGIATDQTSIYSTLQPCFSCLKNMKQAGIVSVRYKEIWQTEAMSKNYFDVAMKFQGFGVVA